MSDELATATAARGRARMEPPDLSEKGGLKHGEPQRSNERLFMQLMAFGGCRDVGAVTQYLAAHGISGAVYEDLNDPRGCAIVSMSTDPAYFLDEVRPLITRGPFEELTLKSEYTMMGRTYALGYEPDLHETLIERPRNTLLNPAWRWGIWYPLRRSGRFSQLSAEEQRVVLAEH